MHTEHRWHLFIANKCVWVCVAVAALVWYHCGRFSQFRGFRAHVNLVYWRALHKPVSNAAKNVSQVWSNNKSTGIWTSTELQQQVEVQIKLHRFIFHFILVKLITYLMRSQLEILSLNIALYSKLMHLKQNIKNNQEINHLYTVFFSLYN